MGEAKKRRDRGEQKWGNPFARLEAEGKGVWRLEILRTTREGLAVSENPESSMIAVYHMFQDMAAALLPPLCMTCDNETPREPNWVVLLRGHCDNPTEAIGSAVCDACAAKPHDVFLADALAHYRKVLDNVRVIDIHPSSGRA